MFCGTGWRGFLLVFRIICKPLIFERLKIQNFRNERERGPSCCKICWIGSCTFLNLPNTTMSRLEELRSVSRVEVQPIFFGEFQLFGEPLKDNSKPNLSATPGARNEPLLQTNKKQQRTTTRRRRRPTICVVWCWMIVVRLSTFVVRLSTLVVRLS